MNKIPALVTTIILMTGIASAQPVDIPEPGTKPGNFLYSLDRASEALELAVARAPVIGSDELEAKVRANHAAERLSEAQELADKNRTEKVGKLMEEYSRAVNRSVASARKSNNTELADRLRNVTSNHIRTLEEVQKKVPETAQKGIKTSIQNSQKQQKNLDNRGRKEVPGQKPGKNSNAGRVEANISSGRIPVKDGNETHENGQNPGKTAGEKLNETSAGIETGDQEEPGNTTGTVNETSSTSDSRKSNSITGLATGKEVSKGGPP